ncbi:MAG: cell envelope integrity protein TolA [Cyclobacteriaceae bacterium]
MIPDQNSNRDKKAMAISVFIHGIVALLFIFILAWREPDPPIPEYGIELNLGVFDDGSGDDQTELPPSPTEKPTPEESQDETTTTEEASAQEQVQTVEPEPTTSSSAEEATEEVEAFDTPSPDLVEPEVVEEVIQNEVVEEVVEEIETIPTEEVNRMPEIPEQIIEDEPVEVTPEVVAPTAKETIVEGKATETNDPAASNQGDKNDVVGDQGDPEGELDARALYGTPGAADGAALELSGWNWDYLPKPDDKSSESGRIVFEITIDDAGYIIGIKTLEKTVTPAVEKVYRDEVLQLTFSPTTDNSRPAPTSTGRITFIIKTK